MRKVYIVFAYNQYYPTGPDDIVGVYLTQEAANARVAELCKYTHKWDHDSRCSLRGRPEDRHRRDRVLSKG